MDPQVLAAAFGAMGKAAQTAPAGPSNAVSPFNGENMFDQGSIGQIVNFGSGSIEAKGETGKTGASAAVSQLAEYMPYALLFVGGLVAWRMTRKA